MERRLAAILAADLVGYSRLIGEDEASMVWGTDANIPVPSAPGWRIRPDILMPAAASPCTSKASA